MKLPKVEQCQKCQLLSLCRAEDAGMRPCVINTQVFWVLLEVYNMEIRRIKTLLAGIEQRIFRVTHGVLNHGTIAG